MYQTSYWEDESFLKDIDYAIVGSGIVGLNSALKLRELHAEAKIVILERGFLPSGASTKNAGFACFGSPSEILSDLKNTSEDKVFSIIEQRLRGLEKLRNTVGDKNLQYREYGSYEIFNKKEVYDECIDKLDYLNNKLSKLLPSTVFDKYSNAAAFGFPKETLLIKNHFEGQIHTGKMMISLIELCQDKNISIFNGFEVNKLEKEKDQWILKYGNSYLKAKKVLISNNAFAKKLIPELDLEASRAQVLITKPIENLQIKGCFHLDEGYYYFRNIDNRVLLGGGRNLDFKTENTFEMETTELIQNKLDELLRELILKGQHFEIDKRWSGIMGIGSNKSTLLKKLDEGLFCGVRLGGMGVAIGTEIGHQLAHLSSEN